MYLSCGARLAGLLVCLLVGLLAPICQGSAEAVSELPNKKLELSELVKKIAESGSDMVSASITSNNNNLQSQNETTSTQSSSSTGSSVAQKSTKQDDDSSAQELQKQHSFPLNTSDPMINFNAENHNLNQIFNKEPQQTQQVAESRQDTGLTPLLQQTGDSFASKAAKAAATNSQKPSNHHNYPADHYPSASYTTMALKMAPLSLGSTLAAGRQSGQGQPSSSVSQSQLQGLSLAQLLGGHFQQSDTQTQPNVFAFGDTSEQQLMSGGWNDQLLSFPLMGDTVQPSSNSRNNLLVGLDDLSMASNQQVFNHNYGLPSSNPQPQGSHSAADFNAKLIQNLTASLFPVQKLNSSMSTLSELLADRNRQPPAQHNYGLAQQSSQSNNASSNSNQSGPASASSPSNYLSALLGDQRLNLAVLDYINRPTSTNSAWSAPMSTSSSYGQTNVGTIRDFQAANQLGQMQNMRPQQPLSMSKNQRPSQYQADRDGPNVRKTSSNIYNTYTQMPAARAVEEGAASRMKTTNGQSLNMASNSYDTYLETTYKHPLSTGQRAAFRPESTGTSNSNSNSNNNNNNNNNNATSYNNQYAHHRLVPATMGQLDKVVYQSNPFRPSIVNPPQQDSNGSLAHLLARPKGESELKSFPYESLSPTQNQNHFHNHNLGSDSFPAGGRLFNSAERNASQFANGKPLFGPKFEPMREHDDYHSSLDQFAIKNSAYNSSSASNLNDIRQQSAGNQTASTTSGQPASGASQLERERANLMSDNGHSMNQLNNPQLLLDLYEREIDNQIREAIHTDHQQRFQQHLTTAASSSPVLAAGNSLAWPPSSSQSLINFDSIEPADQQAPLAGSLAHSWPQQAPTGALSSLGTSSSMPAASQQVSTAALLRPESAPLLSSPESLAAALHELPTFSASDLQPMVPHQLQPAGSQAGLSLVPSGQSHGSGQHQQTLGEADRDLSSLAHFNSNANGYLGSPSSRALSNLLLASAMLQSPFMASQMQADTYPGLVGSSSMASSPASKQHTHHSHSSSSHQSSSSAGGLPSLLLKLQSAGPLSSILTGPFAHIYANLPRYRYQASKGNQGGAAGKGAAGQAKLEQQHHSMGAPSTPLSKQQTSQLLALNSQSSLSPLRLAMLQAQAASNAYLSAANYPQEPAMAATAPTSASASAADTSALENAYSSSSLASLLSVRQPELASPQPTGSNLSAGLGQPLVWRNIFSPIHWSRKQINSAAYSAKQSQHSGSPAGLQQASRQHQLDAQLAKSRQLWPNSAQTLYGPLWGSSSPLAQLVAPSTAFGAPTSASTTTATLSNGHQQRGSPAGPNAAHQQARVRIRILKVPVAFYENASPAGQTSGSTLSSALFGVALNSAGEQLNLVPAHLQPDAAAASLLTSLTCPLHQQAPVAEPAGSSATMSALEQLLGAQGSLALAGRSQVGQPTKQRSSPLEPNSTGGQMASPAGPATNGHLMPTASLSNLTVGSPEPVTSRPLSLKDFTDINQPNDLQISPATRQMLASIGLATGNNFAALGNLLETAD